MVKVTVCVYRGLGVVPDVAGSYEQDHSSPLPRIDEQVRVFGLTGQVMEVEHRICPGLPTEITLVVALDSGR